MQIQSTMTSIALEEYELMKDSKYRVYVSAVDKALKNFEYTSEWADLISALGKLNKVLLNHMKFPVIPRRIKISKRLAQCMHPALPSGVHLKALDTYDIIFKCMGTNRLSHELFIYSAGLFPLLGHAAMNVRPSLLTVYETHFVPLGERLRPGLSGFLSGVLPGLEEGSDHFERTSSLLEKVCEGVGPSYFYGCIWDCLMSNSGIRLPAITYVLSHFNKKLSMEDQLYIMGTNIDTMVGALCAGVQDSSVLVQRSSLDLLLVGFPMHNSQLLRADMVRLVTAALVTILRRDMSLNRRLFAWLLGTEVNISLLNSEHPLVKRSLNAEASNSTPYFDLYSKEMLIQAIKITLSQNSGQDPSDIRPYRILVSLLDKPDIGPVILDDILYEVFRTLYLACEGNRETVVAKPGSNSCVTSYKGSQELLKSANLLFSTLEPCYIWVYTGVLYDKACLLQLDETKGGGAPGETKFKGDVGPVGSGQPSLTEVCTLTEFLLDTVSLEAYMDTPSEHLPGLFLHVISKLTDHCDQLSPVEVARSLQLCAKILSRVQPSMLANNPVGGKAAGELNQQQPAATAGTETESNDGPVQVLRAKSPTSSLEKPKSSKQKSSGSKLHGKNKKSKFKLKQSGNKNLTQTDSPVLVSISRAESEERLAGGDDKFSEDAVSPDLAGSCEQLHISVSSSGRLTPSSCNGSLLHLADGGELQRSVSDADISGYSLSDVSEAACKIPLKQRSVLEQCLKQYKKFYVKFASGKRVLSNSIEQLFVKLSVVLPPETDAERCAKLEDLLNTCLLYSADDGGSKEEEEDSVDRQLAVSFEGLKLIVKSNYCSADCNRWETPMKVASSLLVELSTFPTYCLPESAAAEESKEIPEWLKVLVVCASWLHHSPQLQLTAISTLLDLISLLRSQCEAAESAGHQGVVAVVMVPLLRSWHVSYIENHTNVVQVLARALWHHLGNLGPDHQVTCVELLHQLHNVLPTCNAVENVIGECLTGDDSESFQRFSLLWHIGRDVEAKASVNRSYRSFDKCLLKMLDNLQLGESCPLKLQTQSWLLHSLLRGDISRLLDPLLLILLDPATARMSVLHVNIQHSSSHEAAENSDLQEEFSPTAKIYAISSVDGNVIYHVSDSADESQHKSTSSSRDEKLKSASYPVRAKRIFAITTLVGRNSGSSSKQYVTEKNLTSKNAFVKSMEQSPPLIVHPNHSISVFVNPFASASSNTNSNDSATEDDSTATSSSKTAPTPDFVRKVTRLNPLRKSVELVRNDKTDAAVLGGSLQSTRKSKSAEYLKFSHGDEELSPSLGKTIQKGFEGDNEDNSSSDSSNASECFEDVSSIERRWSVGEDVLKGGGSSLDPADEYLNSNVSDSSSGNVVEAVLHEVLDKVVSQCDTNTKSKAEQKKMSSKSLSPSSGVHHLHSHMLLYCGVYDSSRTLYALHTLRNILLTNARMFLCAAATTGLANVSRGSGLINLLSRHRKSVFGRNFHGDVSSAGVEFSGAYRSSMYLEVLMCSCLYFARSFYPNLGQMRLTQEEIFGNRQVQLASAELLTLICSELIVIVRDSGKGFACFIADLLVRCKMQKVVLHCVLSSVHSMSSKVSGLEDSGDEKTIQRTFTEEIVDFNDPDSEQVEVHWKCKHRSSEQSEGFQVQLLRLLLALVMLEHQVNVQKGDSDAGVVTPKESAGKTPPNSPNQLKYLRGLVIPQQPMFLLAILTALKLEHMRHLHQHWTALVTSALPFMGSSLTDLVMNVINQLCTNIENLAHFYGSKEIRNNECCIPADYAVTQLEALTLLCHYCLLDSTQQQSLMFSQQLLGGISNLNIGVPSANPTQVFNNLVNVFMPMPQQQDLSSNKEKSVMLDSHLSARRTVLGNMPRIIASVSALWQAVMTGNDWEHKSCVLGSPRVVKHHLLEFLSPISLHHGTNFLAAIAVAWQERRQQTPNTCNRKVVPVASPNQQVLVYLVGAIRALPMDTLVQTVNQVVKQPPPIEGAKQDALLEVSVLELFFCYMQTSSGSQLAESWASLVGLLRDGLSLSPPAQFLMLAILNEFVQKCPPLAEKKDLRDLQDITAKLVESCAQIAGACLEQTTWLRRNMAVREEEIEVPSLGKDKDSVVPVSSGQYSVQAQSVLAELLAPLLDVSYGSQEKERVVTILTALMYNITPYLKNHSRRNVPSFYACSQLLASLSSYQYTRKAWRKDVFDLLLDPALFQMEANCLPFWRTVVDNLMTHDNTTFRDLMSRVSLAQSGSLSIFSSREQEYEQRAQLLKRLAFVILCSETDQYHKYMPEIQERLADSLRLPQVVPSIQAQVFLCFRVLLLRMSPQHVTSLWPVIVSELVQVFLHIEQELSTDTEQFSSHIRLMSALDSSWVVNSNNGLHAHGHPHWRLLQLSAAKLLDLALLLPAHRLPQFQMYRWAFVGTYGMDNVNDKDLSDEPPRPPDFVPHVTRIAHLMDHKFQVTVDPIPRQPGQLLLMSTSINALQELHPFFTTLSQHHTLPPLQSTSQLESAIELDFLEKLPPR